MDQDAPSVGVTTERYDKRWCGHDRNLLSAERAGICRRPSFTAPPAPVAPTLTPEPTPGPGSTEPADGEYVSRAVLYKTTAATGNSLTFEALYNGQPLSNANLPTVHISSANGWEKAYFDRDNFDFDPATGRVPLTLTEAGKTRCQARATCTITSPSLWTDSRMRCSLWSTRAAHSTPLRPPLNADNFLLYTSKKDLELPLSP